MAIRINLKKKTVKLGVGDLVSEPLGGGRVSGIGIGARLALGREAHAEYQFRQMWQRPKYGREVSIKFDTVIDDFAVTVQGRIDGVYETDDGAARVVEEVKSVVASPMAFGAIGLDSYPHYVEQLRLYCYLLGVAAENGARSDTDGSALPVTGKMVFVNVADNLRKEVDVPGPYDDCGELIVDRVRVLIERAAADAAWKEARRAGRVALHFPHGEPRRHQDEMMAAVERALDGGRHLMISAPSGIGKTAGALYPAVRYALANDKRVFFVTAKNTQQAIAMETLSKMGEAGPGGLTAVQFRAREKMCINQVYACREEYCAHLQNVRSKLERSRVLDWLLGRGMVDVDALMNAGRVTGLCPFDLALLESERVDVVVCDYNYVFDPQVYFRRFFDEDYKDAILIIDEAHNLVQRAMDYYSPALRRRAVREAAANLDHVEAALAHELKKFFREIDRFFKAQDVRGGDEYSQLDEAEVPGTAEKFEIPSPRPFFEEIKPVANRLAVRYFLDKVSSGRVIEDDPVEKLFAEIGQFTTVLALEGEEFSHVYDTTGGRSLKIVCKDASRFLGERIDGFHGVVAMSATLGPVGFYQEMLGLDPERTDVVELLSPFPRENREIVVVSDVLTTFRHRAGGYDRIAEVIEETVAARVGNYMALFPSYEFLRGVREVLGERCLVEAEVIAQEPRMTEPARVEVLETLARGDGQSRLVLAVQGGIFAEGVDYAGELLCGVIVVSPALPQVSYERDLIRKHFDAKYGNGFDYAYVFPGMSRVIQSVGRLIRTETDRGVAVLVCRRFAQTQYARLFPSDWGAVKMVGGRRGDLGERLREFWGNKESTNGHERHE